MKNKIKRCFSAGEREPKKMATENNPMVCDDDHDTREKAGVQSYALRVESVETV